METRQAADRELLITNQHGPPVYRHTWTFYLMFCNFAAVCGSAFMMGYGASVINEPYQIFERFINSSYDQQASPDDALSADGLDTLWTLTVSLYLAGGAFGGLLGGPQAARLGPKRSLILDSIVGMISGALMLASPFLNNFEMLIVGRAISGIHCGLVSAIVPAFLIELAPLSLRGASGTLNQLSLCVGSLLASVLGLPAVMARENMPDLWPFLFFPCLIFPFIQFILLFFCVESPRWLMIMKKDEVAAIKALKKLRGNSVPFEAIEAEVEELKGEAELHHSIPVTSIWKTLRLAMRWPLFVCVMMQVIQQISGIGSAIFYSSEIFRKAGMGGDVPQYASLGIVGTTVVTALLSGLVIELVGRRSLMIFGLSGMWLSCGCVTVFMALAHWQPEIKTWDVLTIVSLIVFVATFGVGPGPIPWFIAPELSHLHLRAITISMCTFINWLGIMTIGFAYPPIQKILGSLSFLPFFVCISFFLLFVVIFLPETRNRTPEETVQMLEQEVIQVSCCKRRRNENSFF